MKRWYPTLDDVLAIHEIQLKIYGGSPGIRDMGLVEMGLFRPQTGYYKDLLEEAAALWESFMQNHPFIDGNKRTAFEIMHVFLQVNGFDLTSESSDIESFIYGLFDQGEVNFKSLDAWLRENTQAL
jgi:death-on-curing protein